MAAALLPDALGGPLAEALVGWMERGACDGVDVFFPNSEWYPGQKWRGEDVSPIAVALCAGCPVREECFRWAMETPEEHGYWAGTTPTDRKNLARGISRKGCPLCHSPQVFTDFGSQVCQGCGVSWALRRAKKAGMAQVLTNADAAA